MRKQYDFGKARPNPYAKHLKKAVTIRLDEPTIVYFKALAEETGIPYQTLINLYLRDCAASQKKLAMHWKPAGPTNRSWRFARQPPGTERHGRA